MTNSEEQGALGSRRLGECASASMMSPGELAQGAAKLPGAESMAKLKSELEVRSVLSHWSMVEESMQAFIRAEGDVQLQKLEVGRALIYAQRLVKSLRKFRSELNKKKN